MEKTGAEISGRSLPKPVTLLVLVCVIGAVALSILWVFGLSPGGFTLWDVGYYYIIFGVLGCFAFLYKPMRKKDERIRWYDFLFAGLFLGIAIWFRLHQWDIKMLGWIPAPPLDVVLAFIFCLLVLEASRRTLGKVFALICLIFAIYPLVAERLPGMLYGAGFSFAETVSVYTFGSVGFLGIVGKVLGDILVGFMLFAVVLIASGAGKFFMNFAMAVLGRSRAGAAKVAMMASALFATVSGDPISNIAAVGTITIPEMKKTGVSPVYAGAIQACAATGGVLTPPVMGATAFVMAAFLGIPYATIIIAAAIPAILYFLSLFVQVDAYGARVGLKGVPPEKIPPLKTTFKEGWMFLFAIAFLVWGFVYMRWEYMTPYYTTGLLIVLSFLSRRENWMTPRRIVAAFTELSKLLGTVVFMLMPVGIIVASVLGTGLSGSFTSGIVTLGSQNVVLILLLGVGICYIMGMLGLVVAAYVILAITFAPALIQVGHLNVIAAHLSLVYYTMLAFLTPPVAVGAFLAAAVAGASPMATGRRCMSLAIVIYFIPIFFLFNPALIMQGQSLLESAYCFVLAAIGVIILASALEGYLLKVGKLEKWARPPLFVAGVLIAFPEWRTDAIGAVIAAAVIVLMILIRRKQEALPTA